MVSWTWPEIWLIDQRPGEPYMRKLEMKPGLATPPQPESDHLENLAEVLKDIEAVEAAKGIPDTGTEVPAPL